MTATSTLLSGKKSKQVNLNLGQDRQDCTFTLLPSTAHVMYIQHGMHPGYLLDLYPHTMQFGTMLSRGQSILDRFYDNVNALPVEQREKVFPKLLKHLKMKKLTENPVFLDISAEIYHRQGFHLDEVRLAQSLLRTVSTFVNLDLNWYTPIESRKITTAWAYICHLAQSPYITR